ncbi:murein transglycosylase A [Sphingomonas colocasiae]|uniref:peptidoglycan lytic exotransglycosylase n=1 Tax=Sphingomonas colocasiae TaxID=1848973 RepID=A0ABS7PNM6_9SPHN|nr:murein transglycosylase A [Sphingomonas colocasiae]MBY8822868.1 MltA domain-containing protein [Sphingomonas colocasiae]
MALWRGAATSVAVLTLAACSGAIVPPSANAPARSQPARPQVQPEQPERAARPQPATPVAAVPTTAPPADSVNARTQGVVAGIAVAKLEIGDAQARRALLAFRISCPSVQRRTDASGLTRGSDWAPACAAAANWPDSDAPGFFRRNFETVQIGTGAAHATGYFEPEIRGSREKRPGYEVPVYRRPPDLIDVDLGQFNDALKGKRIRGRVDRSSFVPYYDRTQIEEGALAGRGLEIAWAADPVEFFFLQIQGSGRLLLPDGSVMRIGYDNQNGRDYTGIGKLLIDRGEIPRGQGSMQGIMAYLRADPVKGQAAMRENKSFVFFRELTGAGPLGSLGLPVTGRATVAADPAFVPLGAPVFLSLDRAEAAGIWVAQDTGGAIKGANRFDTFWGAGADARAIAGGMSGRGTAFLLLPIGTLARLAEATPGGGTTPRR